MTTRDVARSLGAIATLTFLAVGVPMLLTVRVGNPLPSGLPSWEAVSAAFTSGGVDSAFFVKALALVVWAAWAQVFLAVVAETVAMVRGRMARPVPLVVGSVQATIGRLVAAAAVVFLSIGPRGVGAQELPPITQPPTTVPLASDEPLPTSPPAPVIQTEIGAEQPGRQWTIQRRETLWGIAERTLGDGARFGEIFELNRDRDQPDGARLSDPSVVRPGWVLELPADASQPEATARVDGQAQHVVETGDSLWEIADSALGDGSRFPEIFDLNREVLQPDGRTLVDPGVLESGWILRLPESPVETATPVEPVTITATAIQPVEPEPPVLEPPLEPAKEDAYPPGGSVVGAPGGSPPAGTEQADPSEGSSGNTHHVPVPLIGGGLATAGLVLALQRIRRAQSRRRTSGTEPVGQDRETEDAEIGLRAGSDLSGAELLDRVLRRLAGSRPSLPPECFVVEVRAANGAVAITLSSGAAPPDGFVSGPDDRFWITDPSESVGDVEADGDLPAVLPTLVPLGRDGGEEVLVDLEAWGVLAVDGEDDGSMAVLRSITLSVATCPWADDVEVVVVGKGSELERLAWVQSVTTLDKALDIAERRLEEAKAALAFAGVPSPLHGRLAGVGDDGLIPTVIISAAEPSADELERLHKIARTPQHGVVAAVVGTVDEGCQVTVCADGTARVPALGAVLDPHVLDEEDDQAVAGLLAHAFTLPSTDEATGVVDALLARAQAVAEMERTAPAAQLPAASDDIVAIPSSESTEAGSRVEARVEVVEPVAEVSVRAEPPDHPSGVEVRILGELEVVAPDGIAIDFGRAKSLEVVAYLATKGRAGVHRDDLEFALWPDGTTGAQSFKISIATARKALREASGGAELIPPVGETGGLYALSPEVHTDIDRFRDQVASGSCGGEVRRERLRSALALVSGEPFGARGRQYGWIAGIRATIEGEVVDAAERLAEDCLEAEDGRGAEWAARQGLLASPYDERLYRLLMRAADSVGNVAGVHQAIRELAAKLEADVEPYDSLHPETLELLEQLTSSRRHRSS